MTALTAEAFVVEYRQILSIAQQYGIVMDPTVFSNAARQFALRELTIGARETTELMLLFNMAVHNAPEDPQGILYMLAHVCTSNARVDFVDLSNVFARFHVFWIEELLR